MPRRRLGLLLAFCPLIQAGAAMAQPRLVADLDPRHLTRGAQPILVGAAGRWMYFTAEDDVHGRELWRTDGTAQGTAMVRDICPGPCTSVPDGFLPSFAAYGDRLLFAADDGVVGSELWITDGTPEGTHLLGDLCPGPCSSAPADLRAVGDAVFFSADDGVHGREPWRTDGTAAGTTLIADVCPGACSSWAHAFTPLGGEVLFLAEHDMLWRTDGTAAGTTLIREICSGCDANVSHLMDFGGWLWFSATDQRGPGLWRTDGTPAGTQAFLEHQPGSTSSNVFPSFVLAGKLYYQVQMEGARPTYDLWRTSGSSADPERIAELKPDYLYPGSAIVLDDRVLLPLGDSLVAYRGNGAPEPLVNLGGIEIWLVRFGGQAFFAGGTFGNTSGEPPALWATDGTAAGTHEVRRFAGGVSVLSVAWRDRLVLEASDDQSTPLLLWFSDGTRAGTTPLPNTRSDAASSNPSLLTRFHDSVVFTAAGADGRPAVWRVGPDLQPVQLQNGAATSFATSGDRVYFTGADPGGLWSSGGVSAQLVAPVHGAKFLTAVARADGTTRLLFTLGSIGQQVWTSDGTAAGTVLVADLNPSWPPPSFYLPYPSYPSRFVAFAGQALFAALPTGAALPQLWRTDGTAAGTARVAELEYDPAELTPLSRRVVFAAGRELWATDGTAAGTAMIATMPDGAGPGPHGLTRLGEEVFFFAGNGTGGERLWGSDGTAANTRPVADLGAGAWARELVAAGNRLFFTAYTPATGLEPWTSNGTAGGTLPLEIVAGPVSGYPSGLTAVGSRVFFAADDGIHGLELWQSDGASTSLVYDLAPGQAASAPMELRAAGGNLFFSADDGVHGRELFALAAPAESCVASPAALCLQGGRFAATVNWRTADGAESGTTVPWTDESGLFWFFGPDNFELMIKLLDGRAVNQSFWLFAASLSDVEYSLTVEDRSTGASRSYHHPPGTLCGFSDTTAFPAGAATVEAANRAPVEAAKRAPLAGMSRQQDAATSASAAGCGTAADSLCLGGRFQVEARWRDPRSGSAGAGHVLPLTTETGGFWFFSPANPELLVKVLDGTPVNGRFWVFWSGLTDVEYWLTVTDATTGAAKQYHHPPGPLCGGADTAAF
jgi:ELWxxDGT repeat protein